jgi:Fe-S-cluster containining protein
MKDFEADPLAPLLGPDEDKYTTASSDVDCAARFHLCQARCCRLRFALSPQDLDEGIVRWEYSRPYLIAQRPDGFCVHNQRETGGCGVYANRPIACRAYDCRTDKRIWQDFEARIPADYAAIARVAADDEPPCLAGRPGGHLPPKPGGGGPRERTPSPAPSRRHAKRDIWAGPAEPAEPAVPPHNLLASGAPGDAGGGSPRSACCRPSLAFTAALLASWQPASAANRGQRRRRCQPVQRLLPNWPGRHASARAHRDC